MSTAVMMVTMTEASPRLKARIAGAFYLLTFVTGALALVSVRGRPAANLAATVCYVVVTLLFYDILKPVNKAVSSLAALVSLAGCTYGVLTLFRLIPAYVNGLVFFGVYCLLIGYLVFRSSFLPRILGVLMVLPGFAWLTFLWPALAKSLSPYNLAAAMFGEAALTLWLLVMGVNAERWHEEAGRDHGEAS